jgi:hypothetical protein
LKAWTALKRFWHWLRNPEYPTFTLEEVDTARVEGYQIGLAQGEFRGRRMLAKEMEMMFPEHHAMSAEDVENVKARQLH